MLIFIGGAARTGKSILSRRLLLERQMPYFSLDVLKMGLARGAPEYTIDPDGGGIAVGERLWPLVREMSINLLDEPNYVIEGELLPKHVSVFQQEYPSQVRACFLGYTEIIPMQKLREIRTYAGLPNDWPADYSDAELLNVVEGMIAFSRYLRDECAVYGLPYFDTSSDFEHTLDSVVAHIGAER